MQNNQTMFDTQVFKRVRALTARRLFEALRLLVSLKIPNNPHWRGVSSAVGRSMIDE